MAATPGLKRVLDYKLVFDCLSDGSNGMVPLKVLAARWPRGEDLEGHKLPRGCIEEWRSRADQDGYLDWEGFSTGLATSLKADSTQLQNMADTQAPPTNPKKQLVQRRNSEPTPKAGGRGPGVWLLAHPVEGREIEEFLSECEGEKLVQALTRTRKEVYRCQRSLQQLERAATTKQDAPESKPASVAPSEKAGMGVALGNEKEELQKGMEILERTRQWFNHRLGQLALEKSSNKKIGTEELLAILEGSAPTPANQTLHHLQQINTHLASLARTAPSLLSSEPHPHTASSHGSRRDSTGRELKRLASDPGTSTPIKGQRSHRHTHTSPPATSAPNPSSGARVVAMDIPSSPTSPPTSTALSPRRSNSMKEIRDHTSSGSRRVLTFPSNEGVAVRGGVAVEIDSGMGHYRPRRSNSLKQTGSSQSLNLAGQASQPSQTGGGGRGVEHTAHSPTQQYPLRETVSLTILPGGGGVAPGGPSMGHPPHHYTRGVGVAAGGHNMMPSGKSVSMRNISSRQQQSNSHSTFHTDRLKTSRKSGMGGSLDILPSYPNKNRSKDALKAKQVAAHQRILMMEQYQGTTSGVL